jgi:hypothetical protein
MGSNIILYTHGLFAENDNHLDDLMNSGVTTLVLWSLHVHANGDLFYNDTLLASNGTVNSGTGEGKINPNMPSDLARLRSQGGIGTVMFSIGAGGGCDDKGHCWEPDDFHNIHTLLATKQGTDLLKANFKAVTQWLSLDGFDLDNEEEVAVITVATLAAILVPLGKKNIITFCPSSSPDETFWLKCMTATYDPKVRVQLVKWWNLQYYGGADPGTWIQEMKDYIAQRHEIGVSNPNSFMCPGVNVEGLDPADVQAQFKSWQDGGLALQGGFLWNLDLIYANGRKPADYAKTMAAGLKGQAGRGAG